VHVRLGLLQEFRSAALYELHFGGSHSMSHKVIVPEGSPPPLAPYSPGIKAGGAVYVSGMLAMDKEGKLVGAGDVKAQTRAVLNAIKEVVEAAGGTMADIVFNSIFLKDLADYAAMNEVYREFFPSQPPARYCIRADLVRPEFLVEIASIAHVGS
jgi:aminoacrylate peracid reductase